MISICIPNYNFNCENLLNEIKNEINNVIEHIEVIVVDDKSSINLIAGGKTYEERWEITSTPLDLITNQQLFRN